MRLICYIDRHSQIRIAPAAVRRDWMDKSQQRSAYRCVPLNIANAHGWVILNRVPIMVEWNGADGVDAITIKSLDDSASQTAASIFGSGVLTFPVDGLFRTDPGYDLMVMGPANALKDAIQPLTGIVETDWSPFPFTMNWKFTRSHAPVTFERDEPICMIFPMARGLVEAVEPEFRLFENEPQVLEPLSDWAESRHQFLQDVTVEGSAAQAKQWQKDYFDGGGRFAVAPDDHRTKVQVKPFRHLPD